jgi:hypothetical protein
MTSSRSPYVIGVVAFLIVAGLGVFALSRTGGGPPAAAPSQTPTPKPSVTEGAPTTAPAPDVVKADDGTTVVRLDVVGDCEVCQVVAVAADDPSGPNQWSASVDQGTASVEVPTPNTLGMHFLMKDPRRVQEDTSTTPQTLVFLAPKGAQPGSAVTGQSLKSAGAGSYCWAGTTLDTAIIKLSADVQGKSLQRAWADPALPTLGATAPITVSGKQLAKLRCPSS